MKRVKRLIGSLLLFVLITLMVTMIGWAFSPELGFMVSVLIALAVEAVAAILYGLQIGFLILKYKGECGMTTQQHLADLKKEFETKIAEKV